MKNLFTILMLTGLLIMSKTTVSAQGAWARVFTDNFDNTTSFNNWQRTARFDYNSTLCQYDAAVPAIVSYESRNCLRLTATKNGSVYRSGHVKSNYSFKPAVNEEYRVSAAIKLGALNGTAAVNFANTYGAWPAFWTVQETNWPVNGEIDIFEAYSYSTSAKFASNLFYGTAAGANQLGTTAERTFAVGEGWHIYDEYWKNVNGAVTVTIVVDGVTRSTYTNATNGNLRLENFGPHNVILNMCVGDNYGIFNNSLINLYTSTNMWVDYVTIDRRSTTTTTNPPPATGTLIATIQAESFTSMAGVQTETTTDTGGGQNVGWINANDWMSYNAVTIPTAGTYTIQYRVACLSSGGTIQLERAGGVNIFGSMPVPTTGGWQTWTTISHNVTLPAGVINFAIKDLAGDWNLNWFAIRTAGAREAVASDEEPLDEHSLVVYPNPSNGSVTITVAEPADVEIADANGRVHFSQFVEKQVTLNEMKSGFYIVRARSLKASHFNKLIVK